MRRKKGLGSQRGREQLETLTLADWATPRRKDLLDLLDGLNPRIEELSEAIEQEAGQRPEVKRLMTHPGVGPLTALAFVLIIGSPERFRSGKQIGSYLGLAPCENSSADRQRLGHISKQGNALLRFLPWWRRRKPWSALTPSGDVTSCTWRCVATARSPRWRWHASSPSASIGCGVRNGIIGRWRSLVRTWDSP